MTRLLAVVFAALVPVCALAQTPYMVADLKTGAPDTLRASNPHSFQAIGDTLYFVASHFETGQELWKWSGGEASLVKNITGGSGDSTLDGIFDLGNGTVLVRIIRHWGAVELWRTDGTPDGTSLVKTIGALNKPVPPRATAVFQNKLYFAGDDGVNGAELWVSDGTADGTQMLLNLDGTAASSNISALAVFQDRLLIFAGSNMWSSDGTAAGTTQVATPGFVSRTAQAGPVLFLIAHNTGTTGRELWKTDGTGAGTQLLADIAPGTESGIKWSAMAVSGNTLYFTAAADGAGSDLWKSDGTSAGTQFVTTLASQTTGDDLVVTGALLHISVSDTLWRSDGTAAGTTLLESSGVRTFSLEAAFGQAYYFRSTELRRSDGTATSLVASFSALLFQPALNFTGGKLYFGAAIADGVEPWVSEDGTPATTHQLLNLNPEVAASSSPFGLTAAGDLLFFRANDGILPSQIWRSDGTGGGTFRLTSDPSSNPSFNLLTPWNGALYFKREYDELWRSDGTVAGTAELYPPDDDAMTVYALFPTTTDYLYMSAETATTDAELWRTDGTPAGTISLSTSLDYRNRTGSVGSVVELAERVYATSSNGLWVTQGTPESTKRIQGYSGQTNLTPALGSLLYIANDQLWRTDGSAGGDTIVKDVYPDGWSRINSLTAAGRYVFFIATDGIHGEELWRTDGTPEGTILLADIASGTASPSISRLTAAGDLLYFTAFDTAHGGELWRTDGTPEGTALVMDLFPGPNSSGIASLRFAGGMLWFNANDGTSGDELWTLSSGGVPLLVADLVPGAEGSSPRELVQAGQLLFFAATSQTLGRELWALPLSGAVFSVGDARVTEGTGGTRTVRFTVTRKGAVNGAASVAFATRDVTATSAADYVASSGTLSFSSGETTKHVDVNVQADGESESNESFLLVLSSPVGAVLDRSSGAAIIEDDDRRADISIIARQDPGNFGTRWFEITNAGPSVASDLTLRFSESPQKMELDVGPCIATTENPATCVLDPLPPGQSVLVRVDQAYLAGWFEAWYDAALPPGRTVTASITAAEPDPNPSDNTAVAMMDKEGFLVLPPHLVSGTQATATFKLSWPASSALSITLTSSSPNVTVSPSSVTLAAGQQTATFTLTAGALHERVRLDAKTNGGWPNASVTIAVVAPNTTPKLDVAIATLGSSIVYGADGNVTVDIAARRHDGTRPTGIVTLLDDANGTVVAQQSLDANAATVFTRSGLAPGSHRFRIRYGGDANFNPVEGAVARIDVAGWPTTVNVDMPPFLCAGVQQQIPFIVRTAASPEPPTGLVVVEFRGLTFEIPLSPTGAPGESRAVLQHAFAQGTRSIQFYYRPSGTFAFSSSGESFQTESCAAMNVVATGNGTSVSVSWTGIGAHHYEVIRFSTRTTWAIATTTAGTSHVDLVPANAAYLYTIRAADELGQTIAWASPDLATSVTFTDDPLVPGVSLIRASHIDQLRTASAAMQRLVNFQVVQPITMPVGSFVIASDLVALRDEIERRRRSLGLAPGVYATPGLAAGQLIRAGHIIELRSAVR